MNRSPLIILMFSMAMSRSSSFNVIRTGVVVLLEGPIGWYNAITILITFLIGLSRLPGFPLHPCEIFRCDNSNINFPAT
jgi:hypothetical protein